MTQATIQAITTVPRIGHDEAGRRQGTGILRHPLPL
jgi:hypothetical protein